MIWYDMIYLLTVIGLTPGSSSTAHSYTQTVHRTTQWIWEECWPCPVFASYTLASALQLRKKHGKTSVRVAEECQHRNKVQTIQNTVNASTHITKTHTPTHTHPHITKPTHTHTHTYTHPHITKPTHTHTHPHITKPTHTHTYTYTHPHITKPTHTHPHITKPVKTITVQDTHQM